MFCVFRETRVSEWEFIPSAHEILRKSGFPLSSIFTILTLCLSTSCCFTSLLMLFTKYIFYCSTSPNCSAYNKEHEE